MKTIFRTLIILTILIYTLFVVKPYFDSPFHSDELLDLLSWNGFGALIIMPSWVSWAIILLWLPVSFGMYYYNRHARLAYLIMVVSLTLTLPLFGVQIFTGTDVLLYQIVATFDGIILTMAYLTSINEEFKKA